MLQYEGTYVLVLQTSENCEHASENTHGIKMYVHASYMCYGENTYMSKMSEMSKIQMSNILKFDWIKYI